MDLDDIWQVITEICNKLSFKLFSKVQKNPQNLNIFMKEFNADFKAQMAKLDLDITLSKKLYDALKNEAVSVIKKHTKESAAALDLAKKLYEGYNFKNDPLKVMEKLPKYLKNEVLKKAEKRALKLKTPALKASYLKALKSRENENFNKNLKVAFYEKARFYAKRIALNESARAYNTAKATEFLNDENVQFVKYKMSHTHPRADICDYFANADLYGLGKGIYPKEKAPLTPCHPFCRCNLIPKYSIKGEANLNKKAVELAQKRYFDNLSLKKQSGILGSYDKLKRFKKGENLFDLINKNRPKEYHIKLAESLADGIKQVFKSEILQKQEKEAIKSWSSNHHQILRQIGEGKKINEILNSQKMPQNMNTEIYEAYKKYFKNFTGIFNKYKSNVKSGIAIWRGISLQNGFGKYEYLKKGQKFVLDEKIPSAFSTNKKIARDFAISSNNNYKIIFKTITKGKEIDISEISHNTQESEILLKNGIMFEVLNIRKTIFKGEKCLILHLKML